MKHKHMLIDCQRQKYVDFGELRHQMVAGPQRTKLGNRRNIAILRHAIDLANSPGKALISH